MLFEVTLSGVTLGGMYALVAMGLTLQYGVARIMNLANGEVLVAAAFGTFWFFTAWHIAPFWSLLIVVPIAFVVNWLIYQVLILPLVRRCHTEIPKHFRGPAPFFWVFQVIRDYAARLREDNSRMVPELPRLLAAADELEARVGPIEPVFGHNDLLAANLIDDGTRLWLLDWEYGGFNSPLFDLGGLASNSELSPALEERLLELYFEAAVTDELRRRYAAMRCASLLREAMWSMVSEIHLTVDFDYRAYTAENLARFERAYAALA